MCLVAMELELEVMANDTSQTHLRVGQTAQMIVVLTAPNSIKPLVC